MNLKKIFIICSAAALALTAGCSKSESASEKEPQTNSPESISYPWQAPYEAALADFKRSADYSDKDSAFDITDITGDGVPELLISPNSQPTTRCRIYVLKDDTAVQFGELGSCGAFRYIPSLGLVREEYVGDGFVLGQIYSFGIDELKTEVTYSDNSASASTGASISHIFNGEDLLLPDYDAALAPYDSAAYLNVGRKYSFGDSAVEYALKCSESWGAVLTPSQRDLCKKKLTELADLTADSESDPAFELSDLNGDRIPELIVSNGSQEGDTCTVYYFTGGELARMDGEFGYKGTFTLDPAEFVFFYDDNGTPTYWSIANAEFSTDNYDNKGNMAEIGRKYLLTADSIPDALS